MDEATTDGSGLIASSSALPSGMVTFLFTDIEGSTKLLAALGADEYGAALVAHRRLCRQAFAELGGVEVDTQGDSFFVVFEQAGAAVEAAERAQELLASGPVRVRMGIHTGTPLLHDGGYVGLDVHRGARIAAAAHGGQVVVSATTVALLEGAVALTSLGRHRLKDFEEPIELFQVGSVEHPPLRSIAPSNLPTPASSFVGRTWELAAIDELRRSNRVVTIVGTGGSGKTRVAIEAARRCIDDHPGGTWFVSLSALTDATLVLATVAVTMGVDGGNAPVDAIVERIGELPTLILLDNMEHLRDVAGELGELVRRAPSLTLLSTSRTPLFIDGEHVVDLDPLGTVDAVDLFLERARGARHPVLAEDPAIAALCRRVDHLPLAIELVAARTRVMTPQQILGSLNSVLDLESSRRDVPDRHRTLRSTIVWSHAQLSDDERRAFARLSVFTDGWTVEAAEEVCGCDQDMLIRLLDHSVIRIRFSPTGSARYWMLELLREFAGEQLDAADGHDVLERRTVHVLREASHWSGHLNTQDQEEAFGWFDAELEDVRAVASRLIDTGDPRVGAMAIAANAYLWRRGRGPEGRALVDAALHVATLSGADRARLLRDSGAEALSDGDGATGRMLLAEALQMFRSLGEERDAVRTAHTYGHALWMDGDPTAAREVWIVCRADAERLGEDRTVALIDWNFGAMAMEEGRWQEALDRFDASLTFHRSIDDGVGVAWLSGARAAAAVHLERWHEAVQSLRAAFTLYERVGLVVGVDAAMYSLTSLVAARRPEALPRALGWTQRLVELGLRMDPIDEAGIESLRRAHGIDTVVPEADGTAVGASTWALGVLATLD